MSIFKKYLEAVIDATGGSGKLDFGEYINDICYAATQRKPVKLLMREYSGLEDAMEATGYDIGTLQNAVDSLKACGIKELYNDDEPPMGTIRKFKKGMFDNYNFYISYAYGGFNTVWMTQRPIDESIFQLGENFQKATKEEALAIMNDEDMDDSSTAGSGFGRDPYVEKFLKGRTMTERDFIDIYKKFHDAFNANPDNTYKDKLDRAAYLINNTYAGQQAKDAGIILTPRELLMKAGVKK